MPVDNLLAQTLLGWAPTWYLRPIDVDLVGSYSRPAWVVTLVGYLVLNGLIGPVVEELYFGGWLLPRMTGLGRWAPWSTRSCSASITSGHHGSSCHEWRRCCHSCLWSMGGGTSTSACWSMAC
jgi:membrane protease YdiL (CAAX protease family)